MGERWGQKKGELLFMRGAASKECLFKSTFGGANLAVFRFPPVCIQKSFLAVLRGLKTVLEIKLELIVYKISTLYVVLSLQSSTIAFDIDRITG